MVSHEEQNGVEDLSLLHPDPVVLELNRLKNLLKGSQTSLISFSTEWCQLCFCIHEAYRSVMNLFEQVGFATMLYSSQFTSTTVFNLFDVQVSFYLSGANLVLIKIEYLYY